MTRALAVIAAAALAAPAAAPAVDTSKPRTCADGVKSPKKVKRKRVRLRGGKLVVRRTVRYSCRGHETLKQPAGTTPVPVNPAPLGGGTPVAQPDGRTPQTSRMTINALETPSFRFQSSRSSAPFGTLLIDFVNGGQDDHNLWITRSGGSGDVELVNRALAGEVFHPSIDLVAGSYTLFCSLPGHESMRAPLTVF